MLETMVRMEARMKQWDKERKIFEENVLSILEHRREEMQESFSAQNEKLQMMFEDYKDIRDDITNRTNHLEELAETPKIAFNAYTTSGGSYSDNQKIIFPNVLLNKGGGYSKDTGDFTAPIAGLYHFSAHICHIKGQYMVASIVHEGKEIAITTEYESSAESCSSLSVPAIMNVNEKVFIKSSYGSSKMQADSDYRWPSFSGFLVNK
ncbi:cerebellin-3-like [Mercenaria mercenaria]|uniref:cerebellin-3-like n=1 Tax=Mercenaria mercenaria TaxID=6596 RepID=UPI00234E4054|nr:cerebellin-3-like [Mercenaria mercenaria]